MKNDSVKDATYIGSSLGYRFYEHPEYGDESPMLMLTPDGEVKLSCWYEVPTREEMLDYIDILNG